MARVQAGWGLNLLAVSLPRPSAPPAETMLLRPLGESRSGALAAATGAGGAGFTPRKERRRFVYPCVTKSRAPPINSLSGNATGLYGRSLLLRRSAGRGASAYPPWSSMPPQSHGRPSRGWSVWSQQARGLHRPPSPYAHATGTSFDWSAHSICARHRHKLQLDGGRYPGQAATALSVVLCGPAFAPARGVPSMVSSWDRWVCCPCPAWITSLSGESTFPYPLTGRVLERGAWPGPVGDETHQRRGEGGSTSE